MTARIGLGGMQRNTEALLPLLQSGTGFEVILQPSLRARVPLWTLVRRLWDYAGEVDLYYGVSYGQWPRYLLARLRGRATVCHWAGTDVLRVLGHPVHRLWFQMLISRCIDRHLVVSQNLAVELAALDLEVQLVPLISDLMGEVVPLPDEFTVLAYLPEGRGEFYGARAVYDVAARHPEWRFLILGRPHIRRDRSLPNVVEFDRWQDMRQVYQQVTALVRPTVHDGLPRMVLEALSWGRYVVFSRPFPHCLLGQTADEVESALLEIRTQDKPNRAGSRYVRETYTQARILNTLESVFTGLLKEGNDI